MAHQDLSALVQECKEKLETLPSVPASILSFVERTRNYLLNELEKAQEAFSTNAIGAKENAEQSLAKANQFMEVDWGFLAAQPELLTLFQAIHQQQQFSNGFQMPLY